MKFSGAIGYGSAVGTDGVYEDVITEVQYAGDVIRNTRQLEHGQKVNDDLSVSNSISVVADAYANEHFFAIRYIRWAGACWVVTNVTVQPPRLLLELGGVYNGPVAVTDSP